MPKQLNFVLKVFTVVLILGSGMLYFQYMKSSKVDIQVEKPAPKTWLVEVQEVELDAITPYVKLFGEITTSVTTTLTASDTTKVSYINAKVGQLVNKGEVITRLDAKEVGLAITSAQADISNIQASIAIENSNYQDLLQQSQHQKLILAIKNNKLSRVTQLYENELVSQTDVEEAKENLTQQKLVVNSVTKSISQHGDREQQLESQLTKAKVALNRAKLIKRRSVERTPDDVIITDVYVSKGSLVNASQALVSFYELDNLEVEIKLTDKIKSQLVNKNDITAIPLSDAGSTLIWDRLAPTSVGTATKGFFRFKDTPFSYRVGDGVSLLVKLPVEAVAVAVPYSALYDEQTIYVVRDNVLQAKRVNRVGNLYRNGENLVVITSAAIASGDLIMTTHLSNAISGLPVSVNDSSQ